MGTIRKNLKVLLKVVWLHEESGKSTATQLVNQVRCETFFNDKLDRSKLLCS